MGSVANIGNSLPKPVSFAFDFNKEEHPALGIPRVEADQKSHPPVPQNACERFGAHCCELNLALLQGGGMRGAGALHTDFENGFAAMLAVRRR